MDTNYGIVDTELSILKNAMDLMAKSNSSKTKFAHMQTMLTDGLPAAVVLCKLLKYTYDELNFTYGISPANLIKKADLIDTVAAAAEYSSITGLLDDLNSRKITGHEAISVVNGFVSVYKQHAETIYKIFDRNLMLGMNAKSLNKIVPGLIELFPVALGESYREKDIKAEERWYASQKLDGCRLICKVIDGHANFFFRSGDKVGTMDNMQSIVCNLMFEGNKEIGDFVLDGEICWVKDGVEDFQEIMKHIQNKNHTIPLDNLRFKVFDMLSIDEFNEGWSTRIMKERQRVMHMVQWNDHVSMVEQVPFSMDDISVLDMMKNKAGVNNWEGLILRKDAPYIGDRSRDILKYKLFIDGEFTVIGIENDIIPYFVDGFTGKERKEEMMMKAAIVEYKGYKVNVGSGFTIQQRQQFYANPDDIIGKVMTVKYFEATTNQNGGESMRFPTCKVIHGDKRMT